MEASSEILADGDGDGYTGTFRWKSSKQLQSLPPLRSGAAVVVTAGNDLGSPCLSLPTCLPVLTDRQKPDG